MNRSHLHLSIGLALIGLTLCGTASAAFNAGNSLFIDFGKNDVTNGIIMPANAPMTAGAGNSTGVADSYGIYWNNATMPFSGAGGTTPPPVANLITSANVVTDVSLTFGSGWQANGFQNGGLMSPSSSLLGNFASTNATGDYYFLNKGDGPDTSTLTFQGLDPSLAYDFKIFGTRETPEVRKTEYSITDLNGVHSFTLQTSGPGIGDGGYNGNNDSFATFSGIVPDEFGSITLTMHVAESNFAYIGAMQLTAVPEPGTLVLLGIGCIGVAFLRRNGRQVQAPRP